MLTKVKTLSAVIVLAAAVATPAFAHSAKHARNHNNFRGAYNQFVVPYPETEGVRTPSGGSSWLHPGDINPSGS